MKKNLLLVILMSGLAPATWATTYDQNITAIFGAGNPDTGWTVDSENGLTLGLRAKNRNDASTANTLGTYSFLNAPPTRGLWNYEFSVNSGTAFLNSYDFYLAADQDSSQGISYSTVNALLHWNDNEYGNSSTLNGGGVAGTAASLAGLNSIAQNSQNITFGDYPGGALPLEANATYSYNLYAVRSGDGVNGTRLANVDITVVVGAGGAAVPDSGSTLALLGGALAGIAGLRRKFLA